MSAELKPCPFCGSPAAIKSRKTVMVSCTGCSASTFQLLEDKGSAVEQWSARVVNIPEGFVLVPVEPTEAMLRVGYSWMMGRIVMRNLYDELLAARPEVP